MREGDNLVLKVVLGSSSNVDVTVGVMTSDGSATGYNCRCVVWKHTTYFFSSLIYSSRGQELVPIV